MAARLRKGVQVTLDLLDWRTFVVAGGFVTLLLVGWGFYQALESASEATKALAAQSAQQQDARKATTRRIDLLNGEIARLNREVAAGRDERGALTAKVDALAAQVEQMGGRPVVRSSPVPLEVDRAAGPAPTASSSSQPTSPPTHRARSTPHPSHGAQPPTASPSPTCRPLPLLGTCLP